MVVILGIAWVLQGLAGRLIRIFRGYMQRRTPGADEVQRIETLARVFRNTAAVVIVIVAGKGGLVEEVTLRYVRLRDFDGHVHFVPNGEIKIVTNRTRGFAQAVIEVGVAYREDLDEALEVMRIVGQAMRAEPTWGERIADDVEIIGVERWADSAVILRCRVKVVPAIQQWNVKREFLKRLKKAYDERGIEIPFPHVTIYPGQAKDGSAPPLHLLTDAR